MKKTLITTLLCLVLLASLSFAVIAADEEVTYEDGRYIGFVANDHGNVVLLHGVT